LRHSGLPGDLELVHAVAEEGDQACFDRLIATDDEYLVASVWWVWGGRWRCAH